MDFNKVKFHRIPYILLSSKTFSDAEKVVFTVMLSDHSMNGKIKYSQSQYSQKTGKSRQYINSLFKKLVEKKVLRPESGNVNGSLYNAYILDTEYLVRLAERNDKKVFNLSGQKNKPVRLEEQTCQAGGQTCQAGDTNLSGTVTHIDSIDLTNSKDLYSEGDDILSSSPSEGKKSPSTVDIEMLANEIEF